MTSELQGNVIDLCPVGALTSKPYEFKARPWELTKTETIDVMDAVGSNIRVDARGREVMRILPRINEDVNEEWISDKTRHVLDGLRTQRLDRPYIRENGKLAPRDLARGLRRIAAEGQGRDAGTRSAPSPAISPRVEEMFALKELMTQLGVAEHRLPPGRRRARSRDGAAAGYIFNATIAGIEKADAILIVGANPRREAAVLNARIRKRWRAGKLPVGVIGERADLTYAYDYLGAGPESLAELAAGDSDFAETLKAAKRPLIIVGAGRLSRGRMARRSLARWRAKACASTRRGQGRLERLLRAAHRGLARRRARHRLRARARAACTRRQMAALGDARCVVPARRRRDRHRAPARSSSTSAPMATAAPTAPTSSCRARPIPKSPAPMSTPRAGCRWPSAPSFRRAMPARTGRSSVRCRIVLGKPLPSTCLRSCAPRSTRRYPHLARIDQSSRPTPIGIQQAGALGGTPDKAPFTRRSTISISPIRSRAPPAVMAECSALRLGAQREAAE